MSWPPLLSQSFWKTPLRMASFSSDRVGPSYFVDGSHPAWADAEAQTTIVATRSINRDMMLNAKVERRGTASLRSLHTVTDEALYSRCVRSNTSWMASRFGLRVICPTNVISPPIAPFEFEGEANIAVSVKEDPLAPAAGMLRIAEFVALN